MSWTNYLQPLSKQYHKHVPEEYQKYVPHLWILGAGVIGIYVLRGLISYFRILREVRGLPVKHAFLPAYEQGLRARVPHIPYILPVKDFYSRPEWDRFEKPRSDLLAYTVATQNYAIYWTANPYTAQHVFTKTSLFEKPVFNARYQAAKKFGHNIISASDGDDHKRHKSVVRGCFGEDVFRSAWEEMDNTIEMLLDEDKLREGGIMEDVGVTTIKITYIVIGKVGFGYDIPWETPRSKKGEKMGFVESYEIVDRTMLYQFVLPLWIMKILPTKELRRMGDGRTAFLAYCYEMARGKRAELTALKEAGEKSKAPVDLLGAMVHAQLVAEEEARVQHGHDSVPNVGLKEDEVIGNMFIFLLAGHETTGHTLAFTLAQLALHPEWQEEVYKEVKEVCGDERPSYRDVHRLPLCLAVGLEAMRLTDIVRQLFKVAKEDSMLPYTTWNEAGEVTHREHFVKKGSVVFIDTPACQLNPFHWKDANDFNPRRHLSDDVSRASLNNAEVPFVAFSMGPRQCIGRRFAEVEMICFISIILSKYTIHPVPIHPGETKESMKERMIGSALEDVTMTPGKFSVRFEKRH
ncbi:hypothetical protein I302_108943 [Kwoniella bestiolae CBS 10118]|uniref:Cytochrome P450 n=1 Tax=Kwoniella bestiolae CBS 10118 TaxID=1296100 RepID=A0A1B9FUJ6_9TREE|nr:hypothetical protein I302_08084 [Kwoniella bestiolae CBS 10118]OCF22436.1 hypothetical protein I302_08084 [Kwoniella bestiolae CBS 10118]